MSRSRIDLLRRHQALLLAAQAPGVADDPADPEKDLAAKLLRNGLAVLTFSTIESFIRERTNEVLNSIDPTRINFSELPDGVQRAATLGALKALNFRANLEDKNTRNQFVVNQASKIASLANTHYTLSDLSFAQEKSNLSPDDVKGILEGFRIQSPWEKMKIVASTVGFGGAMSYEEEFRNIAERRHNAAHTMTSQVTQTDLQNSATSILAIAVGFDLIISECLRLLPKRDPTYLRSDGYRFNPNGLRVCEIRKAGLQWKLYRPGKLDRAYQTNTDLEVLYVNALTYAQQHGYAVVQFGPNSMPTRWSFS